MTEIKFPFQIVISLTVMLKIMYIKAFIKLHLLGSGSEQDNLSAVNKTEMKTSKAIFVT